MRYFGFHKPIMFATIPAYCFFYVFYMGLGPQNGEILEVRLVEKDGESELILFDLAQETQEFRDEIAICLWTEIQMGDEHLSYHTIIDQPGLQVFISLQLHRDLCHMTEESIDQVNAWLRLRVNELVQKRDQGKADENG